MQQMRRKCLWLFILKFKTNTSREITQAEKEMLRERFKMFCYSAAGLIYSIASRWIRRGVTVEVD